MDFEQQVLRVAKSCGINDAYFYEGSMFFSRDVASDYEMAEFFLLYPKTAVSFLGSEVAVDFVE